MFRFKKWKRIFFSLSRFPSSTLHDIGISLSLVIAMNFRQKFFFFLFLLFLHSDKLNFLHAKLILPTINFCGAPLENGELVSAPSLFLSRRCERAVLCGKTFYNFFFRMLNFLVKNFEKGSSSKEWRGGKKIDGKKC